MKNLTTVLFFIVAILAFYNSYQYMRTQEKYLKLLKQHIELQQKYIKLYHSNS